MKKKKYIYQLDSELIYERRNQIDERWNFNGFKTDT